MALVLEHILLYNMSMRTSKLLLLVFVWSLCNPAVFAQKQLKYVLTQTVKRPPVAPAVGRAVTTQVAYKTPQKWLALIEPWVLEHKRWPLQGVKEESHMYQGVAITVKKYPNDPASIRLKKLKEQYGSSVASHKTPREWLAIIEPWVLEHKRWPSRATSEERPIYAGAIDVMRRHPDDPVSKRLTELREQYPPSIKKTPQKWLKVLEQWVLKHNRWPSQYTKKERALYDGAWFVMKKYPDNPASVRLKELKEKYQ